MGTQSENPARSGMALKVGVMGGASGDMTPARLSAAETLGGAVARAVCVLVTGACPGLPLAAARGAKSAGGAVLGISPGLSLDEHLFKYRSPAEFHDILVFTGSGLMGREVDNIRTSDIVVIAGGRSGTLGELAIAYDEGKLIGVLTGTGGISDLVRDILAACAKETGARVVYDPDPSGWSPNCSGFTTPNTTAGRRASRAPGGSGEGWSRPSCCPIRCAGCGCRRRPPTPSGLTRGGGMRSAAPGAPPPSRPRRVGTRACGQRGEVMPPLPPAAPLWFVPTPGEASEMRLE